MNLWPNIGIAHLAFRTFIVGFDSLINELEKLNLRDIKPFDVLMEIVKLYKNEKNHKFNYGEVLELVTNFNKMEKEDVCRYALVS